MEPIAAATLVAAGKEDVCMNKVRFRPRVWMPVIRHFYKPFDDVELSETLIRNAIKSNDFNKPYNLSPCPQQHIQTLLRECYNIPYPTMKHRAGIKGDYINGKNSID